ncbi:MAG: hypothetical protein D6773_14235, partial [Alphaproteobacteria bacterium]
MSTRSTPARWRRTTDTVEVRARKYYRRLAARLSEREVAACFDNPVFIVSAPRSGSTLLFTLMMASPDIWTIGGESHGIYAQFPHLRAADAQMSSGRLDATHADARTSHQMRPLYLAH